MVVAILCNSPNSIFAFWLPAESHSAGEHKALGLSDSTRPEADVCDTDHDDRFAAVAVSRFGELDARNQSFNL